MKCYYVYRLTCSHPESVEKHYYGSRKCLGDPSHDRYWSSSRPVKAAIDRYGLSCFTKKIVAVYLTQEGALAREVKMHAYYNVKDNPAFFNRANQTSTKFTTGGRHVSVETRARLVEANRVRLLTKEQRALMSEAASKANRIRRVTKEQRAKIAAASAARSPELRAQVAAKLTGIVRSEETKEKLRNRVVSEETRAKLRNRVVSEETKAKMSAARRRRPPMSEETKAKMSAAQQARRFEQRKAKLEEPPQGSAGPPQGSERASGT